MEENQTWKLIQREKGMKVLPNKWVFKVKTDQAGNIERFKARLVAKGYKQQDGIDFNEVFSPVSKHTTLQTMLSIAATADWEISQIDIKTAFLNGDLEEKKVYMDVPQGYKTGRDQICELKKAIYGLKQAPRAWYLKLGAKLRELDFTPSEADDSLFICRDNGKQIYVLVYVDDILIMSPDQKLVDATKMKLFNELDGRELKDLKLLVRFGNLQRS